MERKASMWVKHFVIIAYDRSRLTPAEGRTMLADRLHHSSYGRAAWFVARGMGQMLKARGDRFLQCIINVRIEMGARKSVAEKPLLKVFT